MRSLYAKQPRTCSTTLVFAYFDFTPANRRINDTANSAMKLSNQQTTSLHGHCIARHGLRGTIDRLWSLNLPMGPSISHRFVISIQPSSRYTVSMLTPHLVNQSYQISVSSSLYRLVNGLIHPLVERSNDIPLDHCMRAWLSSEEQGKYRSDDLYLLETAAAYNIAYLSQDATLHPEVVSHLYHKVLHFPCCFTQLLNSEG